MKRICTMCAFALAFLYCPALSAQFFRYALSPSFDSIRNRPGTTLAQLLDTFYAHTDPATDTVEGGTLDQLNAFARFWQGRVLMNDSSGRNMFQQYYSALGATVAAGEASPCTGGSSFNGDWACIGPDSLSSQDIGRVDGVWADTGSDTGYILAATQGGLFKTTNGGVNWQCITDNAPIVGGILGINCIAVNPLNKNTIYLGTSAGSLYFNGQSEAGAGIIESFDGGATWRQEFLHSPAGYNDSIARVQKIFITPG